MEKSEKKSKKNLFLRSAEFSAIGWGVSLLLHILIIGSLMFLTFSHFLADRSGSDQAFTVELTDASGQAQDMPGLAPATVSSSANGQSGEITALISGPISDQPIILTETALAETEISSQSTELQATLAEPGSFNDSLSGSDTSGSAGFFGLSDSGSGFVYVIDHSGSMEGEKISAALRELSRSIKALDNNVKFYLVFYSDTCLAMPASSLIPANQQNKARYLEWAQTVTAQGGTNPIEAMQLAISLKPDVIWLLSDGEFAPEAAGTIKQANRRKIKINTLAFGAGAGQAQLQQIAAQNYGKFKFVQF
ncbi:MAG: VWA domain-containing protein [Sedimentisphaerales bacterium]|nr:VWA domain-containing protein [Sedimentisphaerales bacterium]MBN2842598.1 VWA domain-containing protein [Sedimentisphaerales bacterium]